MHDKTSPINNVLSEYADQPGHPSSKSSFSARRSRRLTKEERGLVALLLLSSCCHVAVRILFLLLIVPWVGLQCVVETFPDNAHLLKIISN